MYRVPQKWNHLKKAKKTSLYIFSMCRNKPLFCHDVWKQTSLFLPQCADTSALVSLCISWHFYCVHVRVILGTSYFCHWPDNSFGGLVVPEVICSQVTIYYVPSLSRGHIVLHWLPWGVMHEAWCVRHWRQTNNLRMPSDIGTKFSGMIHLYTR